MKTSPSDPQTTKQSRAMKPDAQPFDNISITTRPRYKTSGLSGDEWRISSVTEFYRKGELVHTVCHGNIEYAVRLLDADYINAIESGKAFFAGEGDRCDQEGCENEATVTYKLKHRYCREGHKTEATPTVLGEDAILVRKFCDEHKRRGDCGLEDSDTNYEVVP